MRIEVAGLIVDIEANPEARATLHQRYQAFASTKAGSADCLIEAVLTPSSEGPWYGGELEPEEGPAGLTLRSEHFDARIEAGASRATVRGPLSDRSVDIALRTMLAEKLLQRGGLLVHASAVLIDGRAWVFAGPSGAGKSTLASELSATVLCDEAVALTLDQGSVRAHATPYWTATPADALVRGLVFIQQGEENRWNPLGAGRGTARLLSATGPNLASSAPRVMTVVQDVITRMGDDVTELTLESISAITGWLEPQLFGISHLDEQDLTGRVT